jgi:hypothetical protein
MKTLQDLLCELLSESLLAWGFTGSVRREPDGVILMTADFRRIRIEASPAGLPFRWIVVVNDRSRGAVSLAAVLRQIRAALDPGYPASRVRIAPLPPLSS